MDAVIEDLLAYCSVDTSELVVAEVPLAEVLADALAHREGDVAARRATVVAGDLPVVVGDPVQLGELIQNLVANALKFVPAGEAPHVDVRAERGENADDGIGVDDAHRDRIFAMFQRLRPPGALRGHRYRAVHLQAHRRAPGRHHLGRVQSRRGEPLPLQRAGPGRITGVAAGLTGRSGSPPRGRS